MTASPRVSVLMPVYNAMPWLPVAAESVLAQTFTDFELLLVDDGSTDGSGEACDAIAARDARVRVLRHPGGENRGIVASRNLGLAEACGLYTACLDADDMMYPKRLEKQVRYLDAHSEVTLVGSHSDTAHPTGITRWETPDAPHLARWTLLLENCFVQSSVTFRSNDIRLIGGYDETYKSAEDYDLWQRIARVGQAVNLSEPLVWFNRLRTDNDSTLENVAQQDAAFRLRQRETKEVLPSATGETIQDLFAVLHDVSWSSGPSGSTRIHRLARASRMIVSLHDAFLKHANVPASAQPAIIADRNRRLLQIRLALMLSGGRGPLARLHRPRWDRRARLLSLPSLLSRS